MEIANTPRKKQRLDAKGSATGKLISDVDHGNDLAFSANPSFYQVCCFAFAFEFELILMMC